jgi:DNA gyrase/topoisomerase IV subunit A
VDGQSGPARQQIGETVGVNQEVATVPCHYAPGMSQFDRQSDIVQQIRLLEAKLVAATRAHEVVALVEQTSSSKSALLQVMEAFALTEEQAAVVLDSQFRAVTSAAREQIEDEIRALKASVDSREQ